MYRESDDLIGYIQGKVNIGKYTFIGPHSTIMPNTTIGKGCIVSAYSYVKGNYPDFSIISGNPAKIVGDTRDPIPLSEVIIYLDFPEEYETIALIEASSEFAFKDPSINITWQSKSDKIIERLKVEASNLGANGLVIKNTENKSKQNVSYGKDGETTITNTHYKAGTSTAIYVK